MLANVTKSSKEMKQKSTGMPEIFPSNTVNRQFYKYSKNTQWDRIYFQQIIIIYGNLDLNGAE